MPDTRFTAKVPLTIDCPEPMKAPVAYVFDGEYESHHDGRNLDILDIGANVGSFALWASLRWPGSTVRCYEPNPGTFDFLRRNTAGHANISIHNAAIYPDAKPREPFFARYDGDGEAGLVSYATDTFIEKAIIGTFEVDVVPPASVASADIVKLDCEGAEAEILRHLDLSKTELVLIEFQNAKNREIMRQVLAADFVAVRDEACPWDPILDYLDYRADLKGNVFGYMFYRRRGATKVVFRPPPAA